MQRCGGLGGEGQPQITAAAFDVRQPARAFGATADGQLLWLSLGHAKTFQNCQVHMYLTSQSAHRCGLSPCLAAAVFQDVRQQACGCNVVFMYRVPVNDVTAHCV